MTIGEYLALEVGDRVAADLCQRRITPDQEVSERVIVEVTGARQTFKNVRLPERIPGSLDLRWRVHGEAHHTPAKVVHGRDRLGGLTSQHLYRLTLISGEASP